MKKILSIILSAVLIIATFSFGTVIVNASTIDNTTFSSQIVSLKARFRSGEYWNAYNSCGYEGTGLTKCPSCSGYCRGDCPDSCGQFYYDRAWISGQCLGWACKMGNAIFGGNPLTWGVHYNASNLKPGDIIYGNLTSVISGASTHAIFITNISGQTVTYADCNSIGPCMVKWDRTTTISAIMTATSRGAKIYHASNNAVSSGSSGSLVTPTITFGRSSYTLGDTINISWKASPANSNLSHYWIVVTDSSGNEIVGQGVDKSKTSFSFTPSSVGTYSVKVFATPSGSQSGEGSLTDTKTITVNAAHTTHSYSNACDTTCNVCGAFRSTNHRWVPADCSTPATCYICYATIGVARGHVYNKQVVAVKYLKSVASCSSAMVCYKSCECGAKGTTTFTLGSKLPHKYDSGKVTKAATCKATGVKTYTCSVCKGTKTETIAKLTTHTYSNNCDKSCNVCGKTRTVGAHKYSNSCDTSCNVCKATRTITHAYKTTTTKATLTKNGRIVKKCTVCGKVASNTAIKYAKTIKLSTTSYTYNGKVKTPSVTVKDSAGKTLKKNTDYTVSYASGRKNVGTYKVTIKMIGKYSGSKTLTFKINPAKTTVSKLTAGKKSITVAITKKTTQVTGYQIQYSTSKSFRKATTKTISSYKTTKHTLKSLSAKKTYYVRVRTYKTVGKTKYYSGWSTYKYVKTK